MAVHRCWDGIGFWAYPEGDFISVPQALSPLGVLQRPCLGLQRSRSDMGRTYRLQKKDHQRSWDPRALSGALALILAGTGAADFATSYHVKLRPRSMQVCSKLKGN